MNPPISGTKTRRYNASENPIGIETWHIHFFGPTAVGYNASENPIGIETQYEKAWFNPFTNEYHDNAYFLRDGKITEVPCFEELEELDFPPQLGRLEAAVTSGGLSTAPWTFEGKIERLENKTLRYPGHWAQFVFSIRAVRT